MQQCGPCPSQVQETGRLYCENGPKCAFYSHSIIKAGIYHWPAQPQVSYLSWQNSCHNKHDKHMFVTTKHVCHNKTHLLLQQKYACSNKTFVVTNSCLWQQKFCCDKHTFVRTKDVLCCDKHVFVWLSQKSFVATKVILVANPINDSKTGWWWAS